MTTEDDVRRIALSLPAVTEGPSYGTPGWKVKDKLFARMRENPDALVAFRMDVNEKEALIAAEPDKYFQIPHYEGHPAVLVRLENVDVEELEDILTLAWTVRAPAKLVRALEAMHRSLE